MEQILVRPTHAIPWKSKHISINNNMHAVFYQDYKKKSERILVCIHYDVVKISEHSGLRVKHTNH